MPHPLELPAGIREKLYTMNPPKITPKVTFTGRAAAVISTNPLQLGPYEEFEWNITDRIRSDAAISLSLQKPYLPLDDNSFEFGAGEATIEVLNTDTRFAAVQSGGVIDISSIETVHVKIEAVIDGVATPLRLFKGRVVSIPNERQNVTVIRVWDSLYDALKTPVRFENFGTIGGSTQNSYLAANGRLVILPANLTGMKVYDGYTYFSEDSRPRLSVTNNKADEIDVRDITVKSGARPGRYVITFKDDKNFDLTYPNNNVFQGQIGANFTSNHIDIQSSAWSGTDGTGAMIEFDIYFSVSGNPGTIVKNLIEKAFTETWGSLPGLNIAQWPVDWDSFTAIETAYQYLTLYVSETNDDNSVWDMVDGNRPLSCMRLAQRIFDHIGATIIVDNFGIIRAVDPVIGEQTIYEVTDTYPIIEYEILEEVRANWINFQYGYNPDSKNYAVTETRDIRPDQSRQKVEVTINLPYFKAGVNSNHAGSFICRIIKRKLQELIRVKMTTVPAFSLVAIPGDRWLLKSFTEPIYEGYFEVYRVENTIGQPGVIEAVKIQEPEGVIPAYCNAIYCVDSYL